MFEFRCLEHNVLLTGDPMITPQGPYVTPEESKGRTIKMIAYGYDFDLSHMECPEEDEEEYCNEYWRVVNLPNPL